MTLSLTQIPTGPQILASRPWRQVPPATATDTSGSRPAVVTARPGPRRELPMVVGAHELVPTIDGRWLTYANFDHGASTPALCTVAAAVDSATRTYSSVHRGKGWNSRVTSHLYEAARAEVARFVGARPGDEVIFTRNTTDSFNVLAAALPADTTVLVFASEHHATLLPWEPARTVRLPVPRDARDAVTVLARALAATADRPGPRMVVLTGASNVTGEYWPLSKLVPLAKAAGARVALDAAQLAPHTSIDLAALDVDYVAFSGHKIYAPYGTGVLAGRQDWLDDAPPYLAGGGATAAVTHDAVAWQRGPARHEAGSPNVLGAVALAAACAALSEHTEAIVAHERVLADRLLSGLQAIPGVTILSLFGRDHDRAPVVAFTIAGLDAGLASAALSAEHAIGVRDGKFCAHLLVDALLEGAGSTATAALRVSAGLGTSLEQVERLLAAISSLATHGPDAEYELVHGQGWVPRVETRDLGVALPW